MMHCINMMGNDTSSRLTGQGVALFGTVTGFY